MLDANTAIEIWGVIAGTIGVPDWKLVIYGWKFFLPVSVFAYLIGSIPFGLILTRLAGHGDLRRIGSGSIGTTNVLRTGSKPLAGLTLLLDAGKGALVVIVIGFYYGPDLRYFAAIAVLLGHIFPIWLGFRGGKGVATAFGALLGLAWPAGLAALATWLVVALIFRYSSLAGLVAITLAPLYASQFGDSQIGGIAFIYALLVWLRHIGNIRRLIRGQESRIKLS